MMNTKKKDLIDLYSMDKYSVHCNKRAYSIISVDFLTASQALMAKENLV
jgi:hypothetical protein